MIPLAGRQSGAVLIVALIMLIIITLTGISTAALIKDNTQVIQNFEARASVKSAALSGLQQAIARGTLLSSGVVFASPCTTSRTTCIDANGDGTLVVGQDILVTVSAVSCILTVEKSKADLDPFASAADESCITLVSQTDGTYSPQNVCAEVVWEVDALSEDPVTGSSTTVRQGMATTSPITDIANVCSASGT